MFTTSELGSSADLTGIFTAAYGFKDRKQAADYIAQTAVTDPLSARCYAEIVTRRGTLVPRLTHRDSLGTTNALMLTCLREANDTRLQVLRSTTTEKPSPDAYNVCLLVSGQRKFFRGSDDVSVGNSRVRLRLSRGLMDCYALWSPEGPNKHSARDHGRPYVMAARAARGVVYGKAYSFCNDGSHHGEQEFAVGLEISILDHRKDEPDLLRVRRQLLIDRHAADGEMFDRSPKIDNSWAPLPQNSCKSICQKLPTHF